MDAGTLIEKLENLRKPMPDLRSKEAHYNAGLYDAIEIVRQHEVSTEGRKRAQAIGFVEEATLQPVGYSKPMELLKLLGYVNALVGYCQSLKPGTVIRDDYVKRMTEHYIPNALKAAQLIAELLDSSQREQEIANG